VSFLPAKFLLAEYPLSTALILKNVTRMLQNVYDAATSPP